MHMRRIVTLLVVALGTWGCSGDDAKIAFSTSTAAGTTGSGTHASSTGTHGSTGTHSSTGTGTASSTDTGSTGSDSSTDSSSSDSSSSDSSSSDSSSSDSSSSSSSSSSVASSTTGGGTTSSSTSSGGSIGGCFDAGSYVGLGNAGMCCSGITDTEGICYEPPAPTTSSSSGSTGGQSCGSACLHSGFHCNSAGQCVLNGDTGALQVSLEWANNPRTPADLDLHLIVPAGTCSTGEVYYSSRTCGSLSLDLDANAGCPTRSSPGAQGDDTENIIIATGATPPSGLYIVRVDDYSDSCSPSGVSIPYRVTIRTPTIPTTVINGVFTRGQNDHGSQGAGHEVTRFTLP